MPFTRGAYALRKKLNASTRAELATLLGVTPPTVSRLVRGSRGPSLELGVVIRDRLRIPLAAWSEPMEDK